MPERTLSQITAWARRNWPGGDPGHLMAEAIPADGSPRVFVRFSAGGQSLVALSSLDNPAENRAWHYLAGHLAELDLPVARLMAAEADQGLFLMQDLGRASLQQAALACAGDPAALAELYGPVLAMLARLQAKGSANFDASICFDGADLSSEFLLEREAGYFLKQFVLEVCQIDEADLPPGLAKSLGKYAAWPVKQAPGG